MASASVLKGKQLKRPRVVVVGGGFGGLKAVRHLKRAPADITLIDKRNFHLFQPLLYQVATGSLSPANIAAPLRHLLRGQKNTEVWLEEVSGFDLKRQVVLVKHEREVPFDYLVVAAGARHSYFGHPEWEAFAPGLKTVEDATEIRRRILSAFEAAEHERDESRRKQLLTFVIVGGGPTGVELAGSLAEISRHTLEHEFRTIDPSDARILLIEAEDRVLAMYPPDLSAQAKSALEVLGVTVRCRTMVKCIRRGSLDVAEGERLETIITPTILWAAGVAASPLAKSLADQTGVKRDKAGRIPVEASLSLPGHPQVYVIGDMADCRGANGKPVPGIAPVAMQQGTYVAARIARQIQAGTADLPDAKPFHYTNRGNLATIGRFSAVAEIGSWKGSGFLAWMIWVLIHIANLSQFQNRLLVFVQWIWSFLTFGRSARLITGQPPVESRSGEGEDDKQGGDAIVSR